MSTLALKVALVFIIFIFGSCQVLNAQELGGSKHYQPIIYKAGRLQSPPANFKVLTLEECLYQERVIEDKDDSVDVMCFDMNSGHSIDTQNQIRVYYNNPQMQSMFREEYPDAIETKANHPGIAEVPVNSPINNMQSSEPMTKTEFEIVQKQLTECWDLAADPGTTDNQYVIDVIIHVSRNAHLISAELGPSSATNQDPYYKVFAKRGLEAIQNRHCELLSLPLNKYEQWKQLEVTFNTGGTM